MDPIADVRLHLKAAASESDYTAVNTLWLALLKQANLEKGKDELARMAKLVGRIPAERVAAIVNDPAVDSLLNLEPPLETVVSHPWEDLKTERVAAALEIVRGQRASAPREALAGLGFVLKAIRNKREHGFKTPVGPRDSEILRSARQLLGMLSQAALDARVSAERR
jgi:hypothetical protein